MTDHVDNTLVLGAYALFAGVPDDDLVGAYRSLAQLTTAGALEIPLDEALGQRASLGHLRRGLPAVVPDTWDVVITCIPTVMRQLHTDPGYGLASTNPDGRKAAVADVTRALELARTTAQQSGRRRVRAIEVHSAPSGGSPAALERSLDELLTLDGADAVLAVEHCDAPRPGRQAEKGFLELGEELAVIETIDDPRLGLCINWGRSAIEGRSPATPPQHVALATLSGRLAGLMFSGASDVAGTWGPAWADGHIPPRGAGAAPTAWSESLLGAEEIRETIAAAAGVAPGFLGVKITCDPAGTAVADRIVIARRALEIVSQVNDHLYGSGATPGASPW